MTALATHAYHGSQPRVGRGRRCQSALRAAAAAPQSRTRLTRPAPATSSRLTSPRLASPGMRNFLWREVSRVVLHHEEIL